MDVGRAVGRFSADACGEGVAVPGRLARLPHTRGHARRHAPGCHTVSSSRSGRALRPTASASWTPGEDRFAAGHDFGRTPADCKADAPKWSRYLASVDHTGGATPGNVSLYAVTFSNTFEACYGARWIHCDHDTPVELRFGSQAFAGQQGVVAWVNGERLYAGSITNEPGRKAVRKAVLKKGWNSLVFKANHCQWQWQWQFSCDIACENPDDAASLQISTVQRP